MIPRGLPGEGNILIYDNGGWAGYYAPNPGSPTASAALCATTHACWKSTPSRWKSCGR